VHSAFQLFGRGMLSLCIPCGHMSGSESWSHQVLDGTEWLASWRNHFTARESAPATYWREVIAVPRFSTDILENRKFSSSYQESNHNSLVAQTISLVTILGKGYIVEYLKLFKHFLFGKLNFKLCTISHSSYVYMVEKVTAEQCFILLPAKSKINIFYTDFYY